MRGGRLQYIYKLYNIYIVVWSLMFLIVSFIMVESLIFVFYFIP